MPDPKYHSSSYAFATTAVAEDLDRIATELRSATTFTMAYGAEAAIIHAAERLELQANAMREIALKSYRDQWPTHVEVPAEAVPILERRLAELAAEYLPPIDPDLEGPSYNDPPDEPRSR